MGRIIVQQYAARYVPKTNQLYNPTADVLIIHHAPIPVSDGIGHLDNMVSVEEKKEKPQTKKEVYINGLVSTRLYH